jgi:hypothetical protein
MNPAKKVRYVRALALSILWCALVWIILGVVITSKGFSERVYDAISPPTAVFAKGTSGVDVYFRVLDSVLETDEWIVAVGGAAPFMALLVAIVYFLLKRRTTTWKKIIMWSAIHCVTIPIALLIFMLTIPPTMEWSAYALKARKDTSHAVKILSGEKIITKESEALSKALSAKNLYVLADYGGSGALLAMLIDEQKGKKLTRYEAFYLPLYFASHPVTTNTVADSAEVMLVRGNYFIYGKDVQKKTLENTLLPLAHKILRDTYPLYTPYATTIRTFKVIDDTEYAQYFIQKVVENIKRDIAVSEESYNINNGVIKEYPGLVQALDSDFTKYVAVYEADYQKNCVARERYRNCAELRRTIDTNKFTLENDRITITANYQKAIEYNKDIGKTLAELRKKLSTVTVDSLENNQSESSVGVAFGNDTVYMRYFKDAPINSDYLGIMVHELLHIYSHSDARYLPASIEEGITDLLTGKSFGYDDKDVIRTAGYALEVQTIMALLERIPHDEILSVYFRKNEQTLKNAMKKYFPILPYSEYLKMTEQIFETTYHINGTYHSYDNALLDNEEVRWVRERLGLEPYKFKVLF